MEFIENTQHIEEDMDSVKIGVMLPGATIFNDQNVNPTWRSHIRTHEKITVAFVKRIPFRELYIESVCALLGKNLGLPIPQPFIVQITHECFNEIPEGQFELAFGSEDAGYPSFRRYAQSQEAFERLKEFSKTTDIGIFDEWIANYDRNVGNILYDGTDNFSFIDHEHALPLTLKPSEPARDNQILRVIYSIKSDFEKFRLCKSLDENILPQYTSLRLDCLLDKTLANHYMDNKTATDIIYFLQQRIECLNNLVKMRVQLKQQELAL